MGINLLLIALGGSIGSVFRFLLSVFITDKTGLTFPVGTLVINVIGSFLAGFVFSLIMHKFKVYSMELHALLLVGFLGGFTTFSTFSLETITLIDNHHYGIAILNVVSSIILGLSAAFLGIFLEKFV